MNKITFPKIINQSGHLHLQLTCGELAGLKLKKNDVVKITIQKVK